MIKIITKRTVFLVLCAQVVLRIMGCSNVQELNCSFAFMLDTNNNYGITTDSILKFITDPVFIDSLNSVKADSNKKGPVFGEENSIITKLGANSMLTFLYHSDGNCLTEMVFFKLNDYVMRKITSKNRERQREIDDSLDYLINIMDSCEYSEEINKKYITLFEKRAETGINLAVKISPIRLIHTSKKKSRKLQLN